MHNHHEVDLSTRLLPQMFAMKQNFYWQPSNKKKSLPPEKSGFLSDHGSQNQMFSSFVKLKCPNKSAKVSVGNSNERLEVAPARASRDDWYKSTLGQNYDHLESDNLSSLI